MDSKAFSDALANTLTGFGCLVPGIGELIAALYSDREF